MYIHDENTAGEKKWIYKYIHLLVFLKPNQKNILTNCIGMKSSHLCFEVEGAAFKKHSVFLCIMFSSSFVFRSDPYAVKTSFY